MEKTNKMEETKETQESLQRKREQALQRLRKERTEEALWDCVTRIRILSSIRIPACRIPTI